MGKQRVGSGCALSCRRDLHNLRYRSAQTTQASVTCVWMRSLSPRGHFSTRLWPGQAFLTTNAPTRATGSIFSTAYVDIGGRREDDNSVPYLSTFCTTGSLI